MLCRCGQVVRVYIWECVLNWCAGMLINLRKNFHLHADFHGMEKKFHPATLLNLYKRAGQFHPASLFGPAPLFGTLEYRISNAL